MPPELHILPPPDFFQTIVQNPKLVVVMFVLGVFMLIFFHMDQNLAEKISESQKRFELDMKMVREIEENDMYIKKLKIIQPPSKRGGYLNKLRPKQEKTGYE